MDKKVALALLDHVITVAQADGDTVESIWERVRSDRPKYPLNYCWGYFTQAGFDEMQKTVKELVNASEREKIVSALGDLDVVTLIKEILRSDFHMTKLLVSGAKIGILTSGTIGTDRGLFVFGEEEDEAL